jgi:hypothetical protein
MQSGAELPVELLFCIEKLKCCGRQKLQRLEEDFHLTSGSPNGG